MTTQDELGAQLKTLGIRLTPQRLAIAEVVVNSGDHPSVKQIFGRVKEFFPYVTLATVYSTLTVLEHAGIVRELPFQKQSRYDANLSPHVNLVCGILHERDEVRHPPDRRLRAEPDYPAQARPARTPRDSGS